MDEAERAAQVAQNLPKKEPELSPQYPKPEAGDEGAFHNNNPIEEGMLKYEVYDYFNLGVADRHTADVQEKVAAIIEWAKMNSETKDLAGILAHLRHTETGLGNQIKPGRLSRLYQFVRIQQQKRLLAEKEAAFYA